MVLSSSCRCGAGVKTIRQSCNSSRVRNPAPLGCVSCLIFIYTWFIFLLYKYFYIFFYLGVGALYLLFLFLILFERSEFLIDTSQKKSLRVCTCARVHACTRVRLLLVLVCRIMYHIRTYLISARLPRYVHPTLRTSVTLVVCIEKIKGCRV